MKTYAVQQGEKTLFSGDLVECWKWLVQHYGDITVAELVNNHNIYIS